METRDKLKLIFAGVLLSAFGSTVAQDTEDDQADVWAAVEEQWVADEKGDKKWVDRVLTDDFSGWGNDSPAPRSKSSTKMWDRFNDELGKSVMHELYPLQIVVHGDVAIAHYLYSSAFEDKEGKVKVNSGRYSDVLVRTEEGWHFIAWHGGNDPDDD
jgi:ketosteroid isomerase-like protein